MSVSRETLDLGVSRETLERLLTLVALLKSWNARINLVSRSDRDDLWERHVRDSLQLAAFIPEGTKTAIDMGSGAGFPGLVLAMATKTAFTLIEADARKAAFLREAARVTQTKVSIENKRIEAVALARADLITARALAPLAKLIELGAPLLRQGGTMLFLKGANAENEIVEAQRRWTMRIERHISQTSGGGVILRISEVERA